MITVPSVEQLLGRLDDPDAVVALSGPIGIWAICRQAARSRQLAYLDELAASPLAEAIEDNLPAAEGPGPGARVRALFAAAQLACWSGEDVSTALIWLAEVADAFRSPAESGWEPPSPDALQDLLACCPGPSAPAAPLIRAAYLARPHAGLVAAADLVDDVAATAPSDAEREPMTVALPLARKTDAEIALLSVRHRCGPFGLFPDVTVAPLLRYDCEFHHALERAWHAARLPSRGLRWALTWERTGNPVDAVVGGSVGLAAAVAVNSLCTDRGLQPPRDWVFTGGIDESGSVLSLLDAPIGDAVDLAAYRHKSVAADRRRLVLPAADHGHVAPFIERARLRAALVPVTHVDEVLRIDAVVLDAVARQAPYDVAGPFGECDAARYFGRERALAEVLRGLATGRPVVVDGAPGTGKTSLLQAGLLPALRRGALPGSEHWSMSFVELDGLMARYGPAQSDSLSFGANTSPNVERLVIIDGLDDALAAGWTLDARQALLDQLQAVLRHGARVVVAVRTPCWPVPPARQPLAETLDAHRVVLAPMTELELRRAVLGVATANDLVLEPVLLDAVLAEAAGQTMALPHLFEALHATWRRRTGQLLTLAGHLSAGGVARVVRGRADACAGQLTARQHRILDAILVQLVEVGTQPSDDRRRGCPLAELGELPFDSTETRAVVEALVAARLVALQGDSLCLVHDALVHSWPRLTLAIEARRSALVEERQLLEDALRWHEHGRDSSFLYHGGRLRAACRHVAQPNRTATSLVGRFVSAATARRRRRRLTIGALTALAVLLTVAIAFIPALWSAQRAAAMRQDTQSPLVEIPSAAGRSVLLESHVVTVAQYRRCMDDQHRCPSPERELYRAAKPSDPMTDVTFTAADAYCSWLGRGVPTLQNYLDALGVAGVRGLDDALKEWTRTRVGSNDSVADDWQRGEPIERFLYFINDKVALAVEPRPVRRSTALASKRILNVMNPRSGGVDVGFRCAKEGSTP